MKISFKKIAVGLLLATSVASANAAVYRWSFNYNGVSGGEFAFLDFDSATRNFRLYDNTGQYASETPGFAANGYLASQIGVNGIGFDLSGFSVAGFIAAPIVTTEDAGTMNNFTISGASPNSEFVGDVAGYDYGYITANNGSSNEIGAGESSTFKLSNTINRANISGVAVRLNFNNGGLNANSNGGAVWVVGQSVNSGAPVPEAETSAMMALGLGVLAFVARRRKQV